MNIKNALPKSGKSFTMRQVSFATLLDCLQLNTLHRTNNNDEDVRKMHSFAANSPIIDYDSAKLTTTDLLRPINNHTDLVNEILQLKGGTYNFVSTHVVTGEIISGHDYVGYHMSKRFTGLSNFAMTDSSFNPCSTLVELAIDPKDVYDNSTVISIGTGSIIAMRFFDSHHGNEGDPLCIGLFRLTDSGIEILNSSLSYSNIIKGIFTYANPFIQVEGFSRKAEAWSTVQYEEVVPQLAHEDQEMLSLLTSFVDGISSIFHTHKEHYLEILTCFPIAFSTALLDYDFKTVCSSVKYSLPRQEGLVYRCDKNKKHKFAKNLKGLYLKAHDKPLLTNRELLFILINEAEHGAENDDGTPFKITDQQIRSIGKTLNHSLKRLVKMSQPTMKEGQNEIRWVDETNRMRSYPLNATEVQLTLVGPFILDSFLPFVFSTKENAGSLPRALSSFTLEMLANTTFGYGTYLYAPLGSIDPLEGLTSDAIESGEHSLLYENGKITFPLKSSHRITERKCMHIVADKVILESGENGNDMEYVFVNIKPKIPYYALLSRKKTKEGFLDAYIGLIKKEEVTDIYVRDDMTCEEYLAYDRAEDICKNLSKGGVLLNELPE